MTDRKTDKPYSPPKLAIYGGFSKLTAAGSGPLTESGPGMMGLMRRA
ncbi:lasso RiPP family leader peptide-containing protein [Erythrobacter sp. JK5]|nr:lasso RiPP family leader peptide-containing protein [Erythrobacter sp. JK5]QUL37656.1 lasso RiPP family leader peptide-containing protein [Erythrobacter sp. JK5]